MSLYLVMIADVVRSQKLGNAFDISENLLKANNDTENELLVPFRCLRGDEIEAILDTDCNFMTAVRSLKYRLKPHRIRIGLGFGRLNVDSIGRKDDPFLLNGEAFFAARNAIDLIKNEYKEQESIVLRAADPDVDYETWDLMLRMYSGIINRWNIDQWDASMEYEKSASMEEAAAKLGRLYQSVQRSLDRANWNLIFDCEKWIKEKSLQFDMNNR